MANKTSLDPSAFRLPDGQPIAAELVEADLRARVAKAEETLEDALRQLARFYSMVGRYPDATACVERSLAGARDPAKQAARCLGLGQLLEQQDRHAEAEVHTRTAIAIDPARHNAHKNLGLALAGQGRLGEAAHCLVEADRRCPEDARARLHLVELLAENPEILEADSALAAACRERGIRPGPVGSA